MTDAATRAPETTSLEDLARLHGVETSYVEPGGTLRHASPEALLAVLRALGAPVERPGDAADAMRHYARERERRLVEPVTVAWEGEPPAVDMRVSIETAERGIGCRLALEGGEERSWIDRVPRIELPLPLPNGYHDLTLEVGGRTATTRIIAAPRTAWDPEERSWGVFLPLYALRTRRSWGTGDLGDLEALLDWTSRLGGTVVGTLPLFAAFLDAPFDPRPYAPVSRLFWNELYLDVTRAPELAESARARAILESEGLKQAIARLRQSRTVDYRLAAAAKREVLESLARTFFAGRAWRAPHFQAFLAAQPEARSYAAFRATTERHGEPWPAWPERLRGGALRQGDYDPEADRYHLYVQWLADRQLTELAGAGSARGGGLTMDLPRGVHPDGFDVWRWPDLFAAGVSIGTPPDDGFADGRDHGLPPLHPERIRDDRYAYVIGSLRTLMRQACAVRLEDLAALHRSFWVPHGMDPREGVHVRYRPEELWAILCVESRRHRTAIVGRSDEDDVRSAMDDHDARRAYVLPLELRPEPEEGLAPIPPRSVASLGDAQLPPFAADWERIEPERRDALVTALGRAGCLDPRRTLDVVESKRRRWVMRGALRYLAAGPARLTLVDLEDLWQETEPRDVPGTALDQHPSWSRKARYQLETFTQIPEVLEPLEEIDTIRKQGERTPDHMRSRSAAI